MASFKITDLTELTGGSVADTDVLEIVDLDADQSKKVTIASLKTVFSASEGSSYTGGTANGIMFNDGNTFATSANLSWNGSELNVNVGNGFKVKAWSISGSYGAIANNSGFEMMRWLGSALYINYSDPLRFTFNDSERGRFSNTGFSVGTTSSNARFHLAAVTDEVAQRIDLSNGQTADAFQINSFGNTGGDLFKVDADGNVGIGTTSPVTPFHIHADPAVNGLFAADLVSSISGTQNLFRFGTNGFTSTIFAVKATASVVSFSSWDNNNVIVLNNSGNVGIGATSIDASAKFQIDSTTQGALLPRMTTTQRDAIPSPATGLLIFNTTTKKLDYYSGTAWGQV